MESKNTRWLPTLFFLLACMPPGLAEVLLVEDPLDGFTTGDVVGSGQFPGEGGWRSAGGMIVFDAGHGITDGYFEATMRGWTAPARGALKSHPLSGWENPDQYSHSTQTGSFWNWRIGEGYHPFKVLARPYDQVDRLDERVGSNADVNDGLPHRYRVEWSDGRVAFFFDGDTLAEWQFSRFRVRYFCIGRDDQYPVTNPAPILSDIRIADRDLPPVLPVKIGVEELLPAVYRNAYLDSVRVEGGAPPLTWRLLEGSLPPGVALDTTSGAVTGLPGASGEFSFRMGIRDGSTPTQGDTARLTIRVTNERPVIVSADSSGSYRDSLLVYRPEATDADGNVVDFSVTDLPCWLAWDGILVSGSVPRGAADTSFLVVASDGELADSMTVDVFVREIRTSVEAAEGSPSRFQLYPNYPNPFNGSTTIPYSVDAGARIRLDLHDLQGRFLCRLADAYEEPGRHRVEWDASEMSSGVYVIRLWSGRASRHIKVLLLK